jgi:hypothetical protein
MDVLELAEERLDDDGAPLRRPGQPRCHVRWSPRGPFAVGTWWPSSRDAATELRALVPAASEHLGCDITRFSLHRGDWSQDQPRHITVDGRTIRLGWFDRLPASTVTLGHGTGARVVLRVVPFSTSQSTSEVTS